mgnify:CR=1 FL=1
MAKKVPEEIATELWKAVNRLEIATDIIKERNSSRQYAWM